MKKTIIFLFACFVAAGLWQHDKIADFFKNEVNFSWLSFDETNYAAARTRYMKKGKGPVKIAFISPDEQAQSLVMQFFRETVNGAVIGAEIVDKKKGNGRHIEVIETSPGPGYETVNRSISSLGKDPSVLAVILPYSRDAKLGAEVFAEQLGLLIFHIGHMFGLRDEESYLAFSNTYPFEQFSKKIAMYGEKRGLHSVLMLTEKDRIGEDQAKSQDFWFSKNRILVPTTFLYEKNMISGPMLEELKKNIDIFKTDAVYWGSVGGANLSSLIDSMKHVESRSSGQTENLMFLAAVADNDPAIMKRLQHIESSSLDPVIAYPVIADTQQQAEFDKLHQEKFKINANHAAYYGYDTFMLLADCILRDDKASPQDIAQTLTKKNYKGILATYRFTEDGTLDNQVVDLIKLGKVRNGALVELDIEKIKPAEGKKEIWEGDKEFQKK
jgi:ABC-type branched-subunit amino acid transport system substrate-binding protein